MHATAQSCGSDGSAVLPSGGPQSGGFDGPNTVPCAEQGVAYTHDIQFTMFDAFNFQGQQSVDSIEFLSIGNLPCGLCWSVNDADRRYSANEDGFVTIKGTTNDVAGQYKLALSLKAWINGQDSGLTIPASLVDQTGIRLFQRVKTVGGNCSNVDTSSSFPNNLTASLNCPTGINEISNVSALTIVPNPMTSQAVLTFMAEKSANYTVRVTDITGREVIVKQFEGLAGENKFTIERSNLPGGTYFLLLSSENKTTTHRFAVSE